MINLPINKDVLLYENAISIEIVETTEPSEINLESCDDSMVHFMDNEDNTCNNYEDDNAENNKEYNNKKNKAGRKASYGGSLEETFFAFAHASRAFSDEIVCLLNRNTFACVLTWRNNNDAIYHRFSLNRYLAGHHLALDVITFAHNERALLLRLVSNLCTNIDDSHNKLSHNYFFEDVHSMMHQSGRVEIDAWKNGKI